MKVEEKNSKEIKVKKIINSKRRGKENMEDRKRKRKRKKRGKKGKTVKRESKKSEREIDRSRVKVQDTTERRGKGREKKEGK